MYISDERSSEHESHLAYISSTLVKLILILSVLS